MVASLVLAASLCSTGGLFGPDGLLHRHPGFVTPPGPGYGWGFPNGQPDGYGWVNYGRSLPLGPDRTPDYFFRREYAIPTNQAFLPTYFNPYISRGQRYLPYSNCGGWHPAGGPPLGTVEMPRNPSERMMNAQPVVAPPVYSGASEAPPESPEGAGYQP